MKLNPETVLKRRPFLRLSINSSNEVQVSLEGKLIKCGVEALAIIEMFSTPLSVAAAIKGLGAQYQGQERIAALATLFRLHEGGVLRDVAARDDETTRVAAGDANIVAGGGESGKNFAADEIYFECSLDEPAHELIPYFARDAHAQTPPLAALTLNPSIALQTGDEPPAHLAERLPFLDRFSPRRPLVWVEDAGTEVLTPYWLKPERAKLIERLRSGEVAPAGVEPEIAEQFTRAQILVAADEALAHSQDWQRRCQELRRDLQTEQHAVLRKIIHPLQLAALRRYFRALDAQGQLKASSNKHYAHNRRSLYDEETARFVQRQITALVNRITPAPVRPSHCQVSVYQPGAFLRRHKDQPQYVWNLSLVIDTEPELDAAGAWPIYLEVAGPAREVRLEIGDAVLYRGSEFTHWRETLPAGQSVTLLFCFFSPAND